MTPVREAFRKRTAAERSQPQFGMKPHGRANIGSNHAPRPPGQQGTSSPQQNCQTCQDFLMSRAAFAVARSIRSPALLARYRKVGLTIRISARRCSPVANLSLKVVTPFW